MSRLLRRAMGIYHVRDVVEDIQRGRTQALKEWIEAGGDVNVTNSESGINLMHVAAEYGNWDAFDMLMQHGCNYKHCSNDGHSVLFAAFVGLLDKPGYNQEGAEKIFRHLVALDHRFPDTEGVIVILSVLGRSDILEVMKKHGYDVDGVLTSAN